MAEDQVRAHGPIEESEDPDAWIEMSYYNTENIETKSREQDSRGGWLMYKFMRKIVQSVRELSHETNSESDKVSRWTSGCEM